MESVPPALLHFGTQHIFSPQDAILRSSTLWRTYSSAKRSGPFSGRGCEDDGIFRTCAADEAHVAEALFIGLVAKGPGRGQSRCRRFRRPDRYRPSGGRWGREIDGVLDAVAGPG